MLGYLSGFTTETSVELPRVSLCDEVGQAM